MALTIRTLLNDLGGPQVPPSLHQGLEKVIRKWSISPPGTIALTAFIILFVAGLAIMSICFVKMDRHGRRTSTRHLHFLHTEHELEDLSSDNESPQIPRAVFTRSAPPRLPFGLPDLFRASTPPWYQPRLIAPPPPYPTQPFSQTPETADAPQATEPLQVPETVLPRGIQ
ncbi:hypothetical protein BD289DRAFT_66558 [Coniella lustricola]|uniref:Uncharacterized protein n=1 Tax=Coniella lustricola TaxID=2025994 RepID=A0A2T3AHY6_9PEZI|nr:hypothetical protein BD289DRAFT_66558 [Coniella lustricola]